MTKVELLPTLDYESGYGPDDKFKLVPRSMTKCVAGHTPIHTRSNKFQYTDLPLMFHPTGPR